MAQSNTYTQKAVKQQLSNIVDMLDTAETPFYSMIGTETVGGRTVEWAEDKIRDPKANAAVEGAVAGDALSAPLIERSNYTQIFSDFVNVSGSAAANEQAGKLELARQRENTSKAVKTDVENAFLSASVASAGDASSARTCAGFTAQVDPTNVIDGKSAKITEDALNDLLEIIYTKGGRPSVIMCHPALKRALSKVLKTDRQHSIDNSTVVNGAVDIYESDFGRLEIIPNRFAEFDTGTGVGSIYVIDPTKWKKVFFRNWKKEELAKTGDSIKEQILCEVTLKNTAYGASGVITKVLK